MERKLIAILCADAYGYSRLMGEDEEATHRTLISHRRLIDSLIEKHHGRFVNSAGDSVLAEFASVVNAVQCAVEVQSALKVENASLVPGRRMEFRIGVNSGDVIVDGEQIYGDGVNVAARLESLAEPGGICISGIVHDQVKNKLTLGYADLGKQHVKNITEAIPVFRVLFDGTIAPRQGTHRIPRRYWRGGVLSLAGLAIIVATIMLVQHVSLKPPHTHASIPPAQSPGLPLPDKPSIAVLPFANMSGARNQEYFSDGITNDLITDLARGPDIFVIDRGSSFTYKGKSARAQDVSRELGVKYVLEGAVQREGDRVRVSAQLVDATTGTDLWAEHYDRPVKDIFAVQDDIVRRIATTAHLQLGLWQEHGEVVRNRTQNLEAYDDLLRAISYLYTFSPSGTKKAQEMYQKAISLDPNYADAYAGLGTTYFVDWIWQYSPDPGTFNRAFEAEQKAISLDDAEPYAHALLGRLLAVQRRYDAAVAEGKRSIAIAPNFADCYIWLAETVALAGNPQETRGLAEKAMRLDPRNRDFALNWIAMADVVMGRYTEAIPLIQQFLAHYPAFLGAHVLLAVAYIELGRVQDARTEAAEVLRLSPAHSMEGFQERLAFRDHTINERWAADLRKAGLK